jgi:hypothetical protein
VLATFVSCKELLAKFWAQVLASHKNLMNTDNNFLTIYFKVVNLSALAQYSPEALVFY